MISTIQLLFLGVSLGGVYALMASGLTLVFGVMSIVNIAHASLMIVAAYLSFYAFKIYNVDSILSIVITMPTMFLLGVGIYRLVFTRIEKRARTGELTVLLTFSLALIIEGVLGYFFTNIYRSANPRYATSALTFDPFYIPEGQFYATLLSIALVFILGAYLKYTRTGYAIRATMQNVDAAQVVGVNVERISTVAFGIGMALAGASGSLMSYLFTFYPGKHWEWIAILLSLIGAMTLAIASVYISSYLGPTWSPITFFLALFIVLLIRPQGIFGKKMEA